MSDQDIQDLWTYLKTIAPTNRANREHALQFPYSLRFLVGGWKMLFFKPGPQQVAAVATDPVSRGAYLVNVLGHCGECHTPRNFLGGPDSKALLAGATIPEGKVPNLTPDPPQEVERRRTQGVPDDRHGPQRGCGGRTHE
jgi:mono/diheme cytochrome c family protein